MELDDIDQLFEKLRWKWLKYNPENANILGIHDFDGEFTDLSEEGVKNHIEDLKQDIQLLESLELVDKIQIFNRDLILSQFKTDLWNLEVRKEYLENPVLYCYTLMEPEGSYTVRNFASIEDRVKIIIKYSRNIKKWFADAKTNLVGDLAFPKVKMAISFLFGSRGFFSDQLINFVTQVDDEKLIQEWSEVNLDVLDVIDDFNKFLQKKLKTAHNNFALGEGKFMELLKMTEGVDVTTEKLLRIGEQNLKENYDLFCEIAKKKGFDDPIQLKDYIYTLLPTAENLMEKTSECVVRARQFLIDSGIVSLPSDEVPMVIPTPKSFRKFAFAAMNTPGPFDPPEAKEAYYYVTPPEPEWSEEKTREFLTMFAMPVNEIIAVHEAFPGHFLQLLWSNKAINKIALTFANSYSMVEGWGHYTEQMVLEEGYPHEDPDILKAGQLIEALIRNVRYVVAIKMHIYGMTVEEATSEFMKWAFMPNQNAEIEANRGTVDPLYLNYTLGKLMIYKLREDWKNEQGDEYSLKKFHDTILSYGSPNIAVLRKVMLNSDHGDVL